MANQISRNLPVQSSVSAGAAVVVTRFQAPKTVTLVDVAGTWNGTVAIQVSADGANWQNAVSAITGPGVYLVESIVQAIRVNTSVWVAGTLLGTITGLDAKGG